MPRAFFLFLALFLTSSSSWAADGRADYDLDDNGLIEIDDWADLNEIRNNLDGSTLYGSSAGCPVDGCIGFELTTDLDFDTNGDGLLDSNDTYWNGGEGWQPLGSDYYNSFTGAFHGNGHVIRNLMIARPDGRYQGLFGYLNNATVGDLGLSGPLMSIEGRWAVGGLAGQAGDSQITATFVSGSVVGTDNIGGLVGIASGGITASYVTGVVRGKAYVGGLVGRGSDLVTASLSTAYVSARGTAGGLIGIFGSASASYWAVDASGQTTSYGGTGVKGVTLAELQCPTGADDTTCVTGSTLYADWSSHTDAEGNAYWDFGSNTELPGLRLRGTVYRDGDGDGAPDADDDFPTQFAARSDSDGDGAIDRWALGCDADCRAASGLVLDQFPENAAATVDTDLDGLPDQWNTGCDSACQSASGLTLDEMPGDSDNDGIANHEDNDDNNDGLADADADSDGLIEIATLAELDAVRHSLAGVGKRLSAGGALNTSGCPHVVVGGVLQTNCQGYELTTDLDFDTNGDGALDSNDAYWNGGEGWQPLGSISDAFTGVFHGNGHVIRNLMIARPEDYYQGLFGYLNNASVRELGLSGPLMAIEGDSYVSGLAGRANNSQITATFVSGVVAGSGNRIGGIVGDASATTITASYVTGTVRGGEYVGGLLGWGYSDTLVTASLSTAYVSARGTVGGLIGILTSGSASASYWATDASGQTTSYGGTGVKGVTLAELQCPTGADDTTCVTGSTLYADWSGHTDDEGNAYWDFGSNTELPGLRLRGTVYRDGDGDGAPDADDDFPTQFAARSDSDGDGAIDRWALGCDADCRAASGLVLDQFPENAAATVDTDLDGLPDQWNAGCDSACQSASGLTLDEMPGDSDNDGIGNHDDDDDNNDGITDADADSDGLIDIATLAELDAVRHSLAGWGRRLSADGALDTSGCPHVLVSGVLQARCRGYELAADLDFDTNGDGVLDSNDTYWNGGEGWQPLGSVSSDEFTGVFHGNGHVIRNLMIARPGNSAQGLFGYLYNASVRELGLSGPLMAIEGDSFVGGLAGAAQNSQITATFVSGVVAGNGNRVGGILGDASATPITASYVTGAVRGDEHVGGLVGWGGGLVTASLSSAHVSGRAYVGGLIGTVGTASASYWATDISGQTTSAGGTGAKGANVADLQCPTGADDITCMTGSTLYAGWSSHTDAEGNGYWDFGSNTELPGLRLQGTVYRDGDGDGAENSDDAFPANFAASVDADSDGLPDAWLASCDSACRSASGLTLDTSLNDTDNDSVVNDEDAFVDNAAAAVDADSDGLPDAWLEACDSTCQSTSGLTLDASLNDTDNDGVVNDEDAFVDNGAASVDTDGDGLPDAWLESCDSVCQSASGLALDDDNDNDGVANEQDAFPVNAAAAVDTDSDGLPDAWLASCDSACQSASDLTLDDDNDDDGVANEQDAFPVSAAAAVDADNDGLPDAWLEACDSACQSTSGLTLDASLNDTDNDGVVNDEDAFVNNRAASVDTDGDGLPDAWLASCDSVCQSASGLTLDDDNDNDGVANEQDAFPVSAAAAVDADNDGLPDAWLEACDSTCQSTSGLTLDASLNDTDNDGVVNDEDAFVNNSAASVDTDGDGLPDAWLESCDSVCQSASGLALDDDNDNDGVANEQDAFPVNAAAAVDTDSDGLPDAWLASCDSACQSASDLTLDDDNDDDGVANEQDAFPVSAAAAVDADNDGLPDAWLEACDSACQSTSGLTLDASLNDTDNDGVVNDEDAFVNNRAASVDTDGDGLPDAWLASCDSVCQSASGLTLDDDNDNDGVANEQDAFPVSAAAAVDADNDGLPDAWLEACDSTCQSTSGLTLDASLNDTDNDGVVNDEDAFVNNSAASVDTDGDGQPDSWLDNCDSACQTASGLTLDDDNDNDGVANEQDAFPVNAAAAVDTDNDGLPDAWLEACDSTCQSASGLTLDASLNDTDNDGVVNDEDAFVNNAAASVDADNDGLPDAWLASCDSACQSTSGLTLDASLNDTDNDGVVNDADPYPNDSERWVDVDAPEMQQVPEAISVAATGETTLVILNVMQAQAYDNFDNELEYQVELDGKVLARNAEQQVSLPSGNLALQWVAVDDEGNRSEPMAQTVKIYPMVRFSLSESITGEQNLALVAISLSGPSPEYPVAVLVNWLESDSDVTAADLVTEGDEGVDLANLGVIIESAESLANAALQIPVAGDDLVEPDERFTLELASAWAGSDEPFEMPIDSEHQQHRMTFTDSNIAPTASISATQNGESGTVFTTDAGEVTLAAEVTDVNGGDSHSYQWYTDELPVTPGDQASFTFDPQAMSPGSYRVSIVVTDDGNPMLSSDEVIFEFTLEAPDFPDEDDGDSGDGDSGDEDSGGGDDSSGGENPVSPGGGSSGGSSGGSVGLWLLCLLALGAIWRRRIAG
ncbi:autotransporter subunit C [Microbulbifer sp. SH-1]|uniref:autotransporter subunit C n=1 Tax=Microbulbifer sp. SH-1 TaxID=2681547 RepID=UPI0014096B14|nr:autotransporter subunit C [Microbulbifer sp. SH-1]QIL90744.1 autotransporter subunit C [Microbulbifer sp. SH-1]